MATPARVRVAGSATGWSCTTTCTVPDPTAVVVSHDRQVTPVAMIALFPDAQTIRRVAGL
jgi:hypothetical protein